MWICLLIFSLPNVLFAQISINAAGGNATGSSGSVSYSVGQIFYTNHNGSNGAVAQGVQQPYEISQIDAINDIEANWECSVYPNPANEYLIISQGLADSFSYQLFDSNGRLLQAGEMVIGETRITTQNLFPAMYFLQIINERGAIEKKFQIVKNQ